MISISRDSATSAKLTANAAFPRKNTRRTWRRVVGLVLLVLGLLVLYEGVQLGRQGWAAYRAARELRDLAAAGLRVENLPRVQPAIQKLATALTGLDNELRLLRPLLHGLHWAPKYGSTLAA